MNNTTLRINKLLAKGLTIQQIAKKIGRKKDEDIERIAELYDKYHFPDRDRYGGVN